MSKIRAAGLFLVNKDDKILIGHPTNHAPTFWSIPKGKIDDGETPLEAAVRETYEESNIQFNVNVDNFKEIGKYVYSHKKKDITLFAIFEDDGDDWDKLIVKCNSNVPEDRGGFPEMDDFKWVSIDEATKLLHKTQVDALDVLSDKIVEYRSSKLVWCDDCNKLTNHRVKFTASMTGHKVCNICDKLNPICKLTKLGDGNEMFIKTSNNVTWVDFNDDGTYKSREETPKIGCSLIMGPLNIYFTWQTTQITEIISLDEGIINHVKFKTKNSTYELYYHKNND